MTGSCSRRTTPFRPRRAIRRSICNCESSHAPQRGWNCRALKPWGQLARNVGRCTFWIVSRRTLQSRGLFVGGVLHAAIVLCQRLLQQSRRRLQNCGDGFEVAADAVAFVPAFGRWLPALHDGQIGAQGWSFFTRSSSSDWQRGQRTVVLWISMIGIETWSTNSPGRLIGSGLYSRGTMRGFRLTSPSPSRGHAGSLASR